MGPGSGGVEVPELEEGPADPERGPLVRTVLDPERYPTAVCNDGTPGAYHHRPGVGEGARTWLVVLQGGGACEEEAQCLQRLEDKPHLMSSDPSLHPETIERSGVFDPDPSRNPALAHAHHVLVTYCTSDWWTGDLGATPAFYDLHFRGHRVLEAVIDDLSRRHGLDAAERVVFGGTSAGGVGMYLHLDQLAEVWLPGVEVVGLQDGAWPVDRSPLRSEDHWERLDRDAFLEVKQAWNTPIYDDCLAETGGDLRCYDESRWVAELSTPMFLRQAQRDPRLLAWLEGEAEALGQELAPGQAQVMLRQSVAAWDPRHGAFLPDSTRHVALGDEAFATERIDGVSAMELLTDWLAGVATGDEARRVDHPSDGAP